MPYDDCVNTPGSFPAQTDEKPFHTLAASDDIPRSKSFCHFDPQAKNLVVGRKNAISFASLRSARDDNPWFCAACQQFHPRFESRAEAQTLIRKLKSNSSVLKFINNSIHGSDSNGSTQGLKPICFTPFTARLKSCPDTRRKIITTEACPKKKLRLPFHPPRVGEAGGRLIQGRESLRLKRARIQGRKSFL